MKQSYLLFIVSLFLLLPFSCENYDDDPVYPASDLIGEGDYKGTYWPTDGWRTCHPREVDMDPKILKELNQEVRLLLELQVDFQNLLIVKEGYIVAEQYYSDEYGPDDLHRVFSCTKSLVSACVGMALDKGMLNSLEQRMVDFFPDKDIQHLDPGKADITLAHLLTMSSGMEWNEIGYLYSDERNTYRQWGNAGWGVDFVLNQPMEASPGTDYAYSSGTSHVLSAIVQEATGTRCDSFALKHLLTPLGINKFYWPVDEKGVAIGGSGVRLRPRDMARFGYLYLMNGKWEDEQLLPEDWVLDSQEKHMPRKYIPDQWYGYQFWVNDGYYSAVGFGGQWIMIVPQHDLVVVFNNAFDEGDPTQWETPERLLTNYIIPACE
jgi:CubicO group peptidase (beta-lactamase class C family)